MPTPVRLRFPPSAEPALPRDRQLLLTAASKALSIPENEIAELRIQKVSFDARPRARRWEVRAEVYRSGEEVPRGPATEPPRLAAAAPSAPHVVVVGSGPAGLYCAFDLLASGLRVTVLDRGGDVHARRIPLARIHRGLGVDPDSNYCFGEGGAGTYSDGKLYTRSGNKNAVRRVLELLVAHGADPSILSSWRPHVGSNKLPKVIESLRGTLTGAGAEMRFHTRVEELLVELDASGGRRVIGVEVRDLAHPEQECSRVASDAVVFATGHSARDSLELAIRAGARAEAKGFAMGVRTEHPQSWVDQQQYNGLRSEHDLPAAFYELTTQVDGRGVYSFCMCPGGWIVPATTHVDRVVVNGMSLSRRDSPFASSGLVVQIEPGDWCGERAIGNGLHELCGGAPGDPTEDPLFGVRVQEALEMRCAKAGGGRSRLPAQNAAAFVRGEGTGALHETSYHSGSTPSELHELLPTGIAERLRQALIDFESKMPGYAGEHAQLFAPESRTSSPVRLARDAEYLHALDLEGRPLHGLYPCGEGAGYAGGIVSAALDGRRVAERLCARLGGEGERGVTWALLHRSG